MYKGFLSNSSPFTQLIMLGFTMVACFLSLWLIGLLLAPLLLGVSFTELLTGVHDGEMEQDLNLMRYLQTLTHFGLFIIPAFFASYLFSGTATGYFSLERTVSSKWFIATLALMLAAIPCINMLAALNEMIVFPKSLSGLEQRFKNLEETAHKEHYTINKS